MSTITITSQIGHPEPSNTLVESIPVKEGIKLSTNQMSRITWEDLRGLSWVLFEDYD